MRMLDTLTKQNNNNILLFCSFIVCLIVSINIIATSIGVIWTYFEFSWGIVPFVTILLLSVSFSGLYYRYFQVESYAKLICIISSIIFTLFIYGKFNPVIEIRQDPSIYAFNAFNLLNHGTITRPLIAINELIANGLYSFNEWKGYAKIFNGTQLLADGQLYGDFFPGGTYVYAFLGTISKQYVFYGPTYIMLSVCLCLYFLIYKILHESLSAFLLTTLFLFSPVMTWFGRAFYAGPTALLFFLLILYFLIDYFKFNEDKKRLALIIIIFSVSYFARIEMFMVLLIAIFLIGYQNWKSGLLMLLFSLITVYVASENYPIYHNRMAYNSLGAILYNWNYLATFAYFFSIFFRFLSDRFKFSLESIVSSRSIFYSLLICFSLVVFLQLRNDYADLIGDHQIRLMHNNVMRTYNEDNIDRIFLVFPAHIFVIGLFYLLFVLKNKFSSTNFKIFLLALTVPSLYFIYNISNSPMLYWAIRRYIPVVLPAVFIGFLFFLKDMNYRQRMIVIVASFLIMTNIFFEARQRRDYKGLDKSVEAFTRIFNEDKKYLFMYDKRLRYPISSFMSYGKYDLLPVNSVSEIPMILAKLDQAKHDKILFISSDKHPIDHQQFTIRYQRVAETFKGLPKRYDKRQKSIYLYDIQSVVENATELWTDGKLWPNLKVSEYSGIYKKGWTNGDAEITNINYPLQPVNTTIKLLLNTGRQRVPYKNMEDMGLRLFVNDVEADFVSESGGIWYVFQLPSNLKTIEKIVIKSNTFISKKRGISADKKFGVYLRSIQVL